MGKLSIVGIGGTTKAGSSTEKTLVACLAQAELLGANTTAFLGEDLSALPHYTEDESDRTELAKRFVAAMRDADGIIIASPAYHGTVSGLVKNALDYTQDMAGDARVYFQDRPVGCISTGYGWQGIITTLVALRSVVHGLRGWPTPLGACVNSLDKPFGPDGSIVDEKVGFQINTVAREVIDFATMRSAHSTAQTPR
jgi:FMN reductase